MAPRDSEITRLLSAWSGGDGEALDILAPLVYSDLRQIAKLQFSRETSSQTLQPTALISEFFLTLLRRREVRWKNSAQFFGFAARQMRLILVSHARKRTAQKRGGNVPKLSLEEGFGIAAMPPAEIVRVDEALTDLARFNPVGSRIVEMRFFGGFTRRETAETLGLSPSTVRDKWTAARAWLRRELATSSSPVNGSTG